MIGEKIGHYMILEQLGEGGMGIVYLAEDTRLERKVAIKFLPHNITADPDDRKRFEAEAKSAAALNHPNIATIYAIEEFNDEMFIVMEYVEGKEIKEIINNNPEGAEIFQPLPQDEIINYTTQIANGLQAAHKRGIVHRDIKSSNIMVTGDRQIKIMDFGLAKLQREPEIPSSISTGGTANYMSPEQALGEPVDHRSDIWSFGVVLYEMLTGDLPFKGKHESGILYSIVNSEPQEIENTDYRDELPGIVRKALKKKPDERYQSIEEVLIDLKSFTDSRTNIESAYINKNKKYWFAGVTVIVLLVLTLTIYMVNKETAEDLPNTRTIRVTSYPGQEYDPVFSPGGQTIAFSWNGPNEDNFDIYVKGINGGNPVRLTTAIQEDVKPAWSTDGKKLAFIRNEDDFLEIVIVPSSGGAEQKVAEISEISPEWSNICWSENDRFIFFTTWSKKDRGYVIKKIQIKSKEIEQLTSLPAGVWGDLEPKVLPGGKNMLFQRGSPGFFDLYVMNLNNKSVKKLTHINRIINGFCWHNETESVLFSANLDGTIALWKTNLSGDEPKKVFSEVSVCNPQIFGKKNRLIYNQFIEGYSIWKLNLQNPHEDEVLIQASYENLEPNISPDGEKILFSSDRTGFQNIWMTDSDGSNPTQLTYFENKIWAGNGNWSPDGKMILINFQRSSYKLTAIGGKPDSLGDMGFFAAWNEKGDGFYSAPYPEKRLYNFTAEGMIGKRITEGPGFAAKVYENYIYFVRSYAQPEIWRIPVAGGEEEPVLTGIKDLFLRSWHVVKNGIYFFHFVDKTPVLSYYDFKTKEARLVKRMPDVGDVDIYTTIDIDPNEQYLLYSKKDPTKSDIILVEGFQLN